MNRPVAGKVKIWTLIWRILRNLRDATDWISDWVTPSITLYWFRIIFAIGPSEALLERSILSTESSPGQVLTHADDSCEHWARMRDNGKRTLLYRTDPHPIP